MISIIIPFFNEKENLPELLIELHAALKNTEYEIVFVNDGSTDGSVSDIKDSIDDKKVLLVKMGRQMGKGKALKAGIERSTGEYIVFMDADLQDNPADIPHLINKLEEGFD